MKLDLLKKVTPTEELKNVFIAAKEEANDYNSKLITPRHLLIALAKQNGPCIQIILNKLSMSLDDFLKILTKDLVVSDHPRIDKNIPLSPAANDYFIWATDQAQSLNHQFLHSGHILLSFCTDSSSFLSRILKSKIQMISDVSEEIKKWLIALK